MGKTKNIPAPSNYNGLITGISGLLEQARRTSVRAVNSILTATYWEVGRKIVEFEQGGQAKAEYGKELLVSLARDLMVRHGRGFSKSNLFQMRAFYLGWGIFQTPSGKFEASARCPENQAETKSPQSQTVSGKLAILQTVSAQSQPAYFLAKSMSFGLPCRIQVGTARCAGRAFRQFQIGKALDWLREVTAHPEGSPYPRRRIRLGVGRSVPAEPGCSVQYERQFKTHTSRIFRDRTPVARRPYLWNQALA